MITENVFPTPIHKVFGFPNLYIKREDFIPFSFGGNKARKAKLFFEIIDNNGNDCVVTYGSGNSNHCRIVANYCCQKKIECYIICPLEASEDSFNTKIVELFGASITTVHVESVHDAIERKISELKLLGKNPFFIPGGGHGNIGTDAYVKCYQEIKQQEKSIGVLFDYIFLPSGTGTTQAGLISGQLLAGDKKKIIGISVARKNPFGKNIIIDSVKSYLGDRIRSEEIVNATIFDDEYSESYGKSTKAIDDTIERIMKTSGIPLDSVYTGKAFYGMLEYIKSQKIQDTENILFLHTGGAPLFFDTVLRLRKENAQQ